MQVQYPQIRLFKCRRANAINKKFANCSAAVAMVWRSYAGFLCIHQHLHLDDDFFGFTDSTNFYAVSEPLITHLEWFIPVGIDSVSQKTIFHLRTIKSTSTKFDQHNLYLGLIFETKFRSYYLLILFCMIC